ncbi:MAG: hypothetical protein IT307_08515 [Chloroflexi bacterium]|nr:hypothetical protein [Chloroflexota bacterium]
MRNVGGTSGGLSSFIVGAIMLAAGGYWLLNQVVVTTSFRWYFFGVDLFGLSLVPLLFGVAMLFFNGKNPLGWLLAAVGIVIVFAAVLSNLTIFFRPTSLFHTLIMLALLAGGLGLVGRSMRTL